MATGPSTVGCIFNVSYGPYPTTDSSVIRVVRVVVVDVMDDSFTNA